MWKWLLRRFGLVSRTEAFEGDYEPVYGYPRGQVEAWLARNPQLRQEYEARSRGLAPGPANGSGRAGCLEGPPQRLGGAGRLTHEDAQLLDERPVAVPSVGDAKRKREVGELIRGATDAGYRLVL